jgi:hypothetical protein
VTDRGDDRAILPDLADQVEQRLGAPHGLGREAAGNDQRVHVGRVHVRDRNVGAYRVADLAGVERTTRRGRHHDVGAGLAEPEHRIPQLKFLVLALGENQDAPAAQVFLDREPQAGEEPGQVIWLRALDDLGRGADKAGGRSREPSSCLAAGHDKQIGLQLGRRSQIHVRDDRIAERADIRLVGRRPGYRHVDPELTQPQQRIPEPELGIAMLGQHDRGCHSVHPGR